MEEQNAGKKKKFKRFSTGDANSHNLLENRTLSMPKKKQLKWKQDTELLHKDITFFM